MRLLIGIALWLGLTVPCTWAGAWLQQKGEGFVSGKVQLRRDGEQEASAYAEYGLFKGLTAGLDLNWRNDWIGHAVLFARFPLFAFDDGGRLAVQLGAGAYLDVWEIAPMAKASLQYGRPLGADGWLGAEVAVEHRDGKELAYKLDAVAGLPSWQWAQPMITLETLYVEDFGFAWAVTPSLILDGPGKSRWVAGVELRQGGGARQVGIELSLWQRF